MPSSASQVSTERHPHPVDRRDRRAARPSRRRRRWCCAASTVPSDSVTSLQQRPAEQLGLEVGAPVGGVRARRPRSTRPSVGAAVVLADDQLLGDVDETTGQVARVGGPQGGVDEALAGARRGDEVLEHLEALTEVRLDRAGDHVAAGVGHQAAHAGDLADLHHVPAGTRADHHVDGVELLGLEARPPSPPAPRRWRRSRCATSCWRRSPSVMMPRRNWFSTFSACSS